MDKLPVYEMVIDLSTESDVEVSFVALVDKPAIEKNFMAFKNLRLDFAADIDRQIISGPAMVADTLIYRRDDNGEYNVFFSKQTIGDIALKFFKKDYQKNLNLFHDPALSLQGVTIFESFISDKDRGIPPMKGYEDLPDGTWFISAKVENPEVWAKIKSGEVKGFSVEGIFSYTKKAKDDTVEAEEQVSEILNRTYNADGHLEKTTIMSIVSDLIKTAKEKFFTPVAPAPVVAPPAPVPAPAALSTDYTLKDGVTVASIDMLGVGGVMLITGAPAPAGDYELMDGTKITVGDGGSISAVTPVTPIEQSVPLTPAQQMEAVKALVSKFAVGTPDERTTNLETMTKALMDYCFGWDIERASKEAAKASAIEVYKESFAAMEKKIAAAEKRATDAEAVQKKQEEMITGLFAIVEEMGKEETVEAPVKVESFGAAKEKSREEKRQALITAMKNLKKAQ